MRTGTEKGTGARKGIEIKVGDKLIGYAVSEDLRKRGASGGLVTALLAAALEKGLVDRVLTLKKLNEFEAVPVFTSSVEEVMESAGSMHSVPVNLARYLKPEFFSGKIALPAKPCDARALVERAKRNAVSGEASYVIGLNCGGTLHPETTRKMLETVYRLNPEEIAREEIVRGKLVFFTKDGEEHAVPMDDLEAEGLGRREPCRFCQVKIPTNADLACGNWGVIGEFAGRGTFVEVMTEKGAELLRNAIDAGFAETVPADEKSIAVREKVNKVMLGMSDKRKGEVLAPIEGAGERFEYFRKALENCIHCGACKEACPVCTCGEASKCTAYSSLADSYKMSLFHMVRFLHLSDSCIGCGQCEDVCPAEIPLTSLYQRFAAPVKHEYGYMPGMSDRTPPYFALKLENECGCQHGHDEGYEEGCGGECEGAYREEYKARYREEPEGGCC